MQREENVQTRKGDEKIFRSLSSPRMNELTSNCKMLVRLCLIMFLKGQNREGQRTFCHPRFYKFYSV